MSIYSFWPLSAKRIFVMNMIHTASEYFHLTDRQDTFSAVVYQYCDVTSPDDMVAWIPDGITSIHLKLLWIAKNIWWAVCLITAPNHYLERLEEYWRCYNNKNPFIVKIKIEKCRSPFNKFRFTKITSRGSWRGWYTFRGIANAIESQPTQDEWWLYASAME